MAKSRADYALETAEGEILGVTEVRRQDYESGIAQNASRAELEVRNWWGRSVQSLFWHRHCHTQLVYFRVFDG